MSIHFVRIFEIILYIDVFFYEWQDSVVRNILESCFWRVTGICCSQHSAELFLKSYRSLLFATFGRVVFEEWHKSVVRNILQCCFWWVTEICCSQQSAELCLMSDINLLFAPFCRVVFKELQEYVVRNILQSYFDEWQKAVVRNNLQCCFWSVTEICCSQQTAELCLMSDRNLMFATFCRAVFD